MIYRKVLYSYSSSQIDTGSPTVLLQMVDALDRARFLPVFLAAQPGPLLDEMTKRRVAVIEQPASSVDWRYPRQALRLVYRKYRLLKSNRIAIVHLNEAGWNMDVVIAAYFARIPVILHLHNPDEVEKNNLDWAIARRICLCSHALKELVVGFAAIEAKAIVLHNAVDTGRFRDGKSQRQSLGLSDDELVIGMIGQISRRKGVDIFLATAQRLIDKGHDARFLIIGPQAHGEEDFYKAVTAQASAGTMKNRVMFLGSRRDIPDLLKSMDIFFFPTRAEPFGLVVIEAMAAGLPVIASGVGGIPEILNSEEIGLVVSPPTPDAFVSAIEKVLGMGDARKRMGERARESVDRFSMSRMGTDLQAIYDQLAPSY